jgi:tellurite resistance protein
MKVFPLMLAVASALLITQVNVAAAEDTVDPLVAACETQAREDGITNAEELAEYVKACLDEKMAAPEETKKPASDES